MLAASFLSSSFLRAASDVMLWLVHVQKAPRASKHPYRAKLQTRCDVCWACQTFCPFILTDSGMPRASKRLYSQGQCVAVRQSGQLTPDSTFCSRFIESVRMMAWVICASRWGASHYIACVTASASMARLEVMTLWAQLSSVGTTVFVSSFHPA